MINIKLATKDDFEFFYDLKCENSNIFWTGNGEKPLRKNIKNFFDSCLEKENLLYERKIFIVYDEDIRVGYLYVIPNGDDVDLPVAIAEAHRGRGFAEKAILCGIEYSKNKGFRRLVGHIREDNLASTNVYKKCGGYFTDNYIIERVSTIKNGEVVVENVKMYEIVIDF